MKTDGHRCEQCGTERLARWANICTRCSVGELMAEQRKVGLLCQTCTEWIGQDNPNPGLPGYCPECLDRETPDDLETLQAGAEILDKLTT